MHLRDDTTVVAVCLAVELPVQLLLWYPRLVVNTTVVVNHGGSEALTMVAMVIAMVAMVGECWGYSISHGCHLVNNNQNGQQNGGCYYMYYPQPYKFTFSRETTVN